MTVQQERAFTFRGDHRVGVAASGTACRTVSQLPQVMLPNLEA